MTRINTIDPSLLLDQHLMAEYRELPMVGAALRRSLNSIAVKKEYNKHKALKIPSAYTLNAGHVKFHYDKGLYLRNRYERIKSELTMRGFDINPDSRNDNFEVFHYAKNLYNDWTPIMTDHSICIERITMRYGEKMSWYRMDGKIFTMSPAEYQDWIYHESAKMA